MTVVPFEVPANPLRSQFNDEEWSQFCLTVEVAIDEGKAAMSRAKREKRFLSPGFIPAKILKGNPVLTDRSAEEAAEIVHVAFGEIFDKAHEDFLWEDVLGHTDSLGRQADPYQDFLGCWDSCKQPGGSVLELAVMRAHENERSEDYFGAEYAGLRHERFRFLLSIADELQEIQGEKPILLPETELSALLGVSAQMVSGWRKRAQKRGFLTLVKEHVPHRRATEFHFQIPGL